MKLAVVLAALGAVLLSAETVAAQSAVPGCLQPDRGVVRLVAGVQSCQPTEIAVALAVRQAPAALQLHPTPTAQQVLPQPAVGPDAAMVAFFTAERASAPLGIALTPLAAGLGAPRTPTLAALGSGVVRIR